MKKADTKTKNNVKENNIKNGKTPAKKTITKEYRPGTDVYGSGLDPKRDNYRSKEHKDD